ncbi:MAG: hypothetical protein ACREA2_07010 [Blastocatellia bacterium]
MKIAAFCLCWLLILTAPGVMAQQSATSSVMARQTTTPNQSSTTPNQSWDALRQLQAEEKLEVERKVGKKKVSGKMVSLSDTELVIERKGKNLSFGRNEVKKVWRVVTPSRFDKAKATISWGAIGGAIGVLAGFLILAGSCHDGCGEAEFIGPVAGATVIGGLIGYFGERGQRTLIYSAP